MTAVRSRKMLFRILALVAAAGLAWFGVTAPLFARLRRVPHQNSVGNRWTTGYVVVPQPAKRVQQAEGAWLARQYGLPIVADSRATKVEVIRKGSK